MTEPTNEPIDLDTLRAAIPALDALIEALETLDCHVVVAADESDDA